MTEINVEFYRMIAEMRQLGEVPAPGNVLRQNSLLRYREAREKILDRFLAAFADGYRLEKEDAETEPLTQADLDGMDYDKVWLDYGDEGEWALVVNGRIYSLAVLEGAGFEDILRDEVAGETMDRPSGDYTVYRRPPEGEEDT